MTTKTFPIVTLEDRKVFVEAMVYENIVKFTHIPDTNYTICIMKCPDGWTVQGKSVCVDIEDYDQDVGQRIAYDNCMDKAFKHYYRTAGYLHKIGMKEITVPYTIYKVETSEVREQ